MYTESRRENSDRSSGGEGEGVGVGDNREGGGLWERGIGEGPTGQVGVTKP